MNVGDFASVFLDAATVAVYIGRVTVVAAGVNGAVTISTTAKSGTAPASGATGRTIKVGGAWKGPNGAEAFPYNFITATLKNVAGDNPRVNFKNDANYNITAGMTHTLSGPATFQGYTTAYNDLGRATFDGGTSGASYALLTASGNGTVETAFRDLIFQNNGATGSAAGLVSSGWYADVVERCVVNSVRGAGFVSWYKLIECEAYACNQSNTTFTAGFNCSAGYYVRCIAHDNTGSNNIGFYMNGNSMIFSSCIADTNGLHGFYFLSADVATVINCDAYNNGGDGIRTDGGTMIQIENTNLIQNGGYGIKHSSGTPTGTLRNNGYGSGAAANVSGTTNGLGALIESNPVTYASGTMPWVDPANGDFRINLAAAINAGRGAFTQTAASYAGAIGYPDIGAAQHLEGGGGGGLLVNPGMRGGMI